MIKVTLLIFQRHAQARLSHKFFFPLGGGLIIRLVLLGGISKILDLYHKEKGKETAKKADF